MRKITKPLDNYEIKNKEINQKSDCNETRAAHKILIPTQRLAYY